VLGLLLLPPIAPATEFYSWHAVDAVFTVRPRLELALHGRIRSREEFNTLEQARAGPIVRWSPGADKALYGGYYFQPGHTPAAPWVGAHRLFAGSESRLVSRGSGQLTGRLVFERHFTSVRPSYNRYRAGLRWHWNRRLAPFFTHEWLAVRQGFHSLRNSGGLRWEIDKGLTLELGYLYDTRRTSWGGDRQALVTSLRFHGGER